MTKTTDPYTEKVLDEYAELCEKGCDICGAIGEHDTLVFIEQSLLTQRNEIKERIEGLKVSKREKPVVKNKTYEEIGNYGDWRCELGFNQALEAAVKAVEGEK